MSNVLYGDIDGSEHIVYNNSDASGHMISGIYSACNSRMAGYCPINNRKGIWYFTERYNTRGGGFLSGEVADFTACPIDSILKVGFHNKDEFEQKSSAGTNILSILNSKAPDKAHAMLIIKKLFDTFANNQTVWLTFDNANLSDSGYISMCLGYIRRIITVLPSKVQPLISFACNITTMNFSGFSASLSMISPKYLSSLGSNAAQIQNRIINCDKPLNNIPPCDEFTQYLAVVAAGVPDAQRKAFMAITNTMDHLIKFDVLIRKHSDVAMLNTLYKYASIYNQFYATKDKTKEVVQKFLSALFQLYVQLRNFESFDFQSDPNVKQFEPEYLKIVKANESAQRPPQQTQQPQQNTVRQPEPVREQQPVAHTPTPVYEDDDDLALIRNEQNTAKIYGKKYDKIIAEISTIETNIAEIQDRIDKIGIQITQLTSESAERSSEKQQQESVREQKQQEADNEKINLAVKYAKILEMAQKYDDEHHTSIADDVINDFKNYGLEESYVKQISTTPSQSAPTAFGTETPERRPRAKRSGNDNVNGPLWNPTNDSPAQNFNYNAVFPVLNQKSITGLYMPPAETNNSGNAAAKDSILTLLDTAIDDMSEQINDILHSENYRLSVDTNKSKVDPNNTSLSIQQWDARIANVFTAKDGTSSRPFEFHASVVTENFKNQFYYRFTRGNEPKGLKKDFQARPDQLFDEATQLTIFLLVDELCNYYYADANPIAFNYINRDMKHHFIIKRPYLFYLADMAIEYMKSDYLGTYDNILTELSEKIKKWEKEDKDAYKNESPNADVSPFAEIFFSFVLYIANCVTFSMAKEYSFECRAAIQDALLNKFIDFKLYEKVYKAATYIKVSSDDFENEVIMRTLWVFPKKYSYDTSEKLLPKLLEKCRKYS